MFPSRFPHKPTNLIVLGRAHTFDKSTHVEPSTHCLADERFRSFAHCVATLWVSRAWAGRGWYRHLACRKDRYRRRESSQFEYRKHFSGQYCTRTILVIVKGGVPECKHRYPLNTARQARHHLALLWDVVKLMHQDNSLFRRHQWIIPVSLEEKKWILSQPWRMATCSALVSANNLHSDHRLL